MLKRSKQADPRSAQEWMQCALQEARKAFKLKEVPVGAVVVLNDKIIARAHNLSEDKNDFTAHAEVLALKKAINKVGRWEIQKAELYVTLEPCAMCSGAIILSRISKVIYGAKDPKAGADVSALKVLRHKKINHQTKVQGGILKEECGKILTEFFKELRVRLKKRR